MSFAEDMSATEDITAMVQALSRRWWLFIISYPGLSRFGDVEMTVGDLGTRLGCLKSG